jgi:hypothetical protein
VPPNLIIDQSVISILLLIISRYLIITALVIGESLGEVGLGQLGARSLPVEDFLLLSGSSASGDHRQALSCDDVVGGRALARVEQVLVETTTRATHWVGSFSALVGSITGQTTRSLGSFVLPTH